MNYENLHTIICRYEDDLENICGKVSDERFKWLATKAWQDAFHSPDITGNFKEKFNFAKKQFGIFIDNGFQHPSTGIIKLWEKEPDTVEHLLLNVLLSDTGADISQVKNNIDQFLDEYERLRIKYYPKAVSYKLTPHIASVFLTMDKPDFNYVFRISVAKRMANYIGFEDDLGTGTNPNLENYYRMCDIIVSALKEHESLIEKHSSLLTDKMYKDHGLHLMVFDLMHCSGYRGYYAGLAPITIGKPKKKTPYKGPSPEEIAQREQERLDQIASLEQKIEELELSIEDFEEISLLGVEVTFPKYGVGPIIRQELNKITVKFPETEKSFVLDKSYTTRPRFENDDEIVEAFTVYGHTHAEIEKLRKRLADLQQ